jgi:hypothetical protein
MGCGQSAQPSIADAPEIPAVDLSKLDRYEKFEHTLPFYRMRIDVFEGRVKRFVTGKNSVTIEQLRYAFKNEKNWEDLQHNDGLLFRLVNSEEFRDEENTEEINI